MARVLVTGMGGELGARVTGMLEHQTNLGRIVGIDFQPPRRRLVRAEFHRLDPRSRTRIEGVVRALDPTAIVHLAVYEPNARTSAAAARAATTAMARAVLAAARGCPSLERIVVRSGIEVYGRGRGSVTRPDETVHPVPTTEFGRSLRQVEELARAAGAVAEVPVTSLRLASVVGPHVPSPLGRILRMPVVPVSAISDLPFSLVHQEDAAAAIVAALATGWDGPLNVVAAGAVTASQACRLGGRLPLPVVGPLWSVARVAAELAGAPMPHHVHELLVRGRVADGTRLRSALSTGPALSTIDVVKELYEWAPVTTLDLREGVA
jgi:UDP-glucose 4-epimerase